MALHKKFTFNGLAGLVLLVPVLCMFYLKETGMAQTLPGMYLAVNDRAPSVDSPYNESYEDEDGITTEIVQLPPGPPSSYKFIDVNLKITGNTKNDSANLELGRKLIRDAKKSKKDFIMGFCFDKGAKYNEFIQAIAICQEEKVTLWALEKNFLCLMYRNRQI